MPTGGQLKELRATMRRLLWKMLLQNKYGLKKPGDFTVSEGHGYPLVFKIKRQCFLLWVKSLDLDLSCIFGSNAQPAGHSEPASTSAP
jgi:hypothetical protein